MSGDWTSNFTGAAGAWQRRRRSCPPLEAVLISPHCGGPRMLIAFLTDGLGVRKILGHLGLPTEPPALAPARAPPEPELAW